MLQLLNDVFTDLARMERFVETHRELFARNALKDLQVLEKRVADAVLVLNKTDWQKEIAEVA